MSDAPVGESRRKRRRALILSAVCFLGLSWVFVESKQPSQTQVKWTDSEHGGKAEGPPGLRGHKVRQDLIAPSAPKASGSSPTPFVVKSLASRELVKYAEFRLGAPPHGGRVQADGSAVVRLTSAELATLRSADKHAEVRVEHANGDAERIGTIWLGTRLNVRVHCSFDDGTGPAEDAIGVVRVVRPFGRTLADDMRDHDTGSHVPDGDRPWHARLRLNRHRLTGRFDGHGVLTIATLNVRSQGLSVSVHGFTSSFVEIPRATERSPPPTVDVAVVLQREQVIQGVLLDDQGRPLKNQRIDLLVSRKVASSEVSIEGEASRGLAFGVTTEGGGTVAYIKTKIGATTGPDGRFRILTSVNGPSILLVHRPGFLAGRESMASTVDSPDIELRLQRPRGPTVCTLVQDGKPLGRGSLRASDMSRHPQSTIRTEVDDHGRFQTEWFDRGVVYEVRFIASKHSPFEGRVAVEFTWRGQAEIDVSEVRLIRSSLVLRAK